MAEIQRLQDEAQRKIADLEKQKQDLDQLAATKQAREQEIMLQRTIRDAENARKTWRFNGFGQGHNREMEGLTFFGRSIHRVIHGIISTTNGIQDARAYPLSKPWSASNLSLGRCAKFDPWLEVPARKAPQLQYLWGQNNFPQFPTDGHCVWQGRLYDAYKQLHEAI